MARSGRDTGVVVSLERERERTIELLSQHFAYDNLTLDELEHRMELVYRAMSVPALRELTKDLPGDAPAAAAQAVAVPDAFAPERGRIVSFMAETRRRGLWRPPRKLDLWCIMSDTRPDLTEAQLKTITCPVVLFAGNTPDEVHHVSAAENVHRLVPHAELRPSAWTHEEWDVIGQHDHTFPGIAATNRYSMKATFYAAELLDFIRKVEG